MPPTPHRHGGLRRRKSIYHAMPRLKCLSALASIKMLLDHSSAIAISGILDHPLSRVMTAAGVAT
jgi:hypothetical protein